MVCAGRASETSLMPHLLTSCMRARSDGWAASASEQRLDAIAAVDVGVVEAAHAQLQAPLDQFHALGHAQVPFIHAPHAGDDAQQTRPAAAGGEGGADGRLAGGHGELSTGMVGRTARGGWVLIITISLSLRQAVAASSRRLKFSIR